MIFSIGKNPIGDVPFSFSDQVEKEPPTALLWGYYYLAQHYDFLKQTKKALEHVNAALEHTPLLIELHALKAKIYKVHI